MPKPVGAITRGTTGVNRLRRCDRWLAHSPRVRRVLTEAADPLVVDLGYGALPVTTLELAARLRAVRSDLRVTGLEIDPERVATAAAAAGDGVDFALGGFELAGLRPVLVRAFNVLRQYPEHEVLAAWARLRAGVTADGLIVDGTCDELGRRCAWVLLDAAGPVSLTLACDPRRIDRPSDLAERLPKALIHRNVDGEPIHDLLRAADRAWANAAGHGVFGPRARWRAMLAELTEAGTPIEPQRRALRDAVLTVPWSAVAPVR
ncbi:SAM-dependent methyltransferase [Mycolicibacterium brumae]|uniref:SAM-dependent methyltransferase n=1 Tax=Mycolicibacterium brumae TaxID=85968 RepID=A0A2G5PGQ8_9MYCO|nr:SAM-dependent methyltransferase [Mycolicibacterium brumae]MCV7192502.1 class I SAM-dependent methyltransferase [Mycolicibacterium brumae]PIB77499.1 SAM-dependent methyltransferase [Mycolicibacterium brumae]RWA18506.1 methylase [Mycolicibacterium brumae DSM 44177]UWW10270.1 class I SAM-dependent methyltransferase [Mycolicibacterium brumae]